jgi:hypothetical protein
MDWFKSDHDAELEGEDRAVSVSLIKTWKCLGAWVNTFKNCSDCPCYETDACSAQEEPADFECAENIIELLFIP